MVTAKCFCGHNQENHKPVEFKQSNGDLVETDRCQECYTEWINGEEVNPDRTPFGPWHDFKAN